jgi:hypothetical protein
VNQSPKLVTRVEIACFGLRDLPISPISPAGISVTQACGTRESGCIAAQVFFRESRNGEKTW